MVPSSPPGGAASPRAGRGGDYPGNRAGVSVLVGEWDDDCGAAALAEQGQVEEGIAQMQQGLAAFRAMGAELARLVILPCWPRRMGKWGR